jgi:hypothetical protein
VSENRVPRAVCGPKGEEVVAGWRRLHNEELRNLYAPPIIIGVIKSKRKRWDGHVERMVEMRYAYKLWSKNLKMTTWETFRRTREHNIKMDLA